MMISSSKIVRGIVPGSTPGVQGTLYVEEITVRSLKYHFFITPVDLV